MEPKTAAAAGVQKKRGRPAKAPGSVAAVAGVAKRPVGRPPKSAAAKAAPAAKAAKAKPAAKAVKAAPAAKAVKAAPSPKPAKKAAVSKQPALAGGVVKRGPGRPRKNAAAPPAAAKSPAAKSPAAKSPTAKSPAAKVASVQKPAAPAVAKRGRGRPPKVKA